MNSLIRKFFLTAVLPAGLLMALVVVPAAAQSRAIKGKVTDEKGQPVQDAQITIQGIDIYRNITAKTNKKGEYFYLLGLQSGLYRIVVRKAGYQPQYKENVKPEMGEQVEVDFQLVPGQDYKLPFEMTDEEKEQYKKQLAQQEKRKQFSAEVKEHFDAGVQLAGEEKYAEAADEFNKAIEKDPNQPGILSRLGDAYLKLGKNDEALAAYEKAVAMDPADPGLYTNMGVALSKLGKVTEAQEAFKKAATTSPGAAAQSYYNLGVTLFNTHHVEEAVDAFKKSIAADPNYAEAYYQLGMCLSEKQETIPAAVEALEKYIRIGQKPDQVEVAKQIVAALKGK
jgi:tetratricopeptide (TPR) repeat protein